MSDIRQKIVKSLIVTKLGLTTREIAEDLNMKVQVVNGSLGQMAQSGFIERGEYIEGEGQIWKVTELGITEYGNKTDVESLLTQNEKPPVETVESAPIVEESALEQNLKPSNSTELEQVAKEFLTTEIEDFETRINPNQKSAIYDFEKHEVSEDHTVKTYSEEYMSAYDDEMSDLIDNLNPISETMPKHAMTPESFQVWQIVDEAGAKMIELLKVKQAKPIENIDYKIATLESLADIYNPKISATLRAIAADLRG